MKKSNHLKTVLLVSAMLMLGVTGRAQSHGNRLSLGVGALYERGLDATLAVEHETKNHNAWEYFANGYIKWDKDEAAGHVTRQSFWNNYRTWGLGIAYKPCVIRSRNKYGSLRIGASAGSDSHEFVGWANVGYEHNYVLRHGWQLYWHWALVFQRWLASLKVSSRRSPSSSVSNLWFWIWPVMSGHNLWP